MTEMELAANATLALERLREDETDIVREIDHLNARLEIVREIIAMLAGARSRGRPKGSGRKASVPTEPLDATLPELEIADAGTARNPATLE
jgi:hypothetical protein